MTLIRNRSRLLRLVGVMLLTAAVAMIPVSAAFADNSQQAGSGTLTAIFPPTPVEDLSASFNDDNTTGQVALSWEDPANNVNPLCYGPMFMVCLFSALGFIAYAPADLDAATEYVIERRQLEQNGRNGYPINGAHDWTEIARVGGTTASYTDAQLGTPSRTMDYRVKACNDQGCSGWSQTSVYIRYPWCAFQPNLCD